MHAPQVMLVSGSNSGFGRLIVETLARQGHSVFAGIRASATRNAAAAQELTTLARQDGLALSVVDLDVTDDASVERAVGVVMEARGRLDVVVNNAGIAALGPTEAFTLEQVRQQFDPNVFGVLRMNRAALPHMRAQGSGLLVQIGSVLGRIAYPFTGLYAATKFALEGLTEAYRLELAALGIDAVIVEPGAYPTNLMTNEMFADDPARLGPYEAFMTQVSSMMAAAAAGAAGSTPDPQEVANTVAHLIAMPAGTRPLRTVVAIESQRQVPLMLNERADQGIQATRQALGWERLTTLNVAGGTAPMERSV